MIKYAAEATKEKEGLFWIQSIVGTKACQGESVARTPLISVDPEAERPGPEMGPGYNLQGLPPVIRSLPGRSLKPFTVSQNGVITLGQLLKYM